MPLYVNVPLPKTTYRYLQKWADLREQAIGEAIAEYLTDTLISQDSLRIPPAEPDTNVQREKAAYLQMHPQLKTQFLGHFVAIHNGELVDHDLDYGTLFERIDSQYPEQFVWLIKVEKVPESVLSLRSPRFILED